MKMGGFFEYGFSNAILSTCLYLLRGNFIERFKLISSV